MICVGGCTEKATVFLLVVVLPKLDHLYMVKSLKAHTEQKARHSIYKANSFLVLLLILTLGT